MKSKLNRLTSFMIIMAASLLLAAAFVGLSRHDGKKAYAATPSSTNPCVSQAAPSQWKHVVILMFENKTYSQVIGSGTGAPFITNLASQCATAYSGSSGATPKNNWHDADYKVDGTKDGSYVSKPNYATLTSGVSPSAHGLLDDTYSTTTGVNNIYNLLNGLGKNATDYYDGPASTDPCGGGSNFSGAYHDAIRYYTDIGGKSTSTSTYCNTHDKPLTQFMTDVNAGKLPDYSMILPTNSENMHDNSISSGDTWAQNFLNPFFDSAQYKSGDTAVFFLWDEDTAIPNVLIAPSIVPGTKVPTPTGNPVSHFSALRTAEEMLGISSSSFLGDTASAPSLLSVFNGGGTPPPPPPDNPPTVSVTAPSNGSTITSTPVTISANASDTDTTPVSKVEFYDGSTLLATDTTSPYSYSWDVTGKSGSHTITAKAYDTAGLNSSASVTVTISLPTGCQAIPTTYGTATTTVSIPSGTTYNIWSRIMAPDTTNNSYYLQVDSNCAVNVGDSSSIPANSWAWLNYKDGNTASTTTATLAAGSHTITMIGREPGVRLDRILFLSSSCTPTGTGENCADTTPPTATLTSPTSGQTVSGTLTLSANALDNSGGSGIAKVDFMVDGVNVGTSTANPYQVSWNSKSVTDGSHSAVAKATDIAGNAGTSVPVNFTVKNADTTPPSAPSNLTITKNVYNEVDLSWGASTDNVGVTGYQVLRNGISVATVTGTTYQDKSVLANTSYSYSVVAQDAAGNQSSPSNSVLVTTPQSPDSTPPSAPTNLTVTKNVYNEVDLSWGASTDNVDVAGYRVLRGGVVIGTTSSTTYADKTVLPSTAYSYAVVAYDAAGNVSAQSNQQSLTTPNAPDTTPPSAPSNLTASATSTQINLSWNASSDNVGVAGYYVYRNSARLATVNTTSYGDATATAGVTYTYYVVAFDAAGNISPQSNQVSASLTNSPPPTTLNFIPSDDAYVRHLYPDNNYGSETTLRVDQSPVYHFLMKFNVSGIGTRTVSNAVLQLYTTDSSGNGGTAYSASTNSWSEGTVTWNNAPLTVSSLTNVGKVSKHRWVSIDLSNFITKDGTYSLIFKTTSNDTAIYGSKESKTQPVLTINAQ